MNKVVLVDDEIYARQGLKKLIDWEQYGFKVCEEAENGEEALRVIQSTNPDLIVTDIRMPVLDGLELIRSVRESGNKYAKFIIISGYNDFKYAQQAIKFGVQDFILKPIDEEELKSALNNLSADFDRVKLQSSQEKLLAGTVLEQVLKGKYDENSALEKADILGLPQTDDFYYLIVEVNGIQPFTGSGENTEAIQSVKDTVNKVLLELSGHSPQLHMFEQQAGIYGFLLSSVHLHAVHGELEAFAQSVIRLIERELDKEILIYTGAPARRIGDLKNAFSSANAARMYKYAFPREKLFFYEKMKGSALNYLEIDQQQYAELLECMEEHDSEAIRQAIECIFAQFQTKCYAPEAVRNSLNRCVFGAIHTIKTMKGNEKRLKSLDAVLQWPLYPLTLEQLKALFSDFILQSSQMIVRLRKENAKGDIAKIKAYIEVHFSENINLKSIAGKFFINPVYLGQLFKKTYGMYFNDFLLQIRIQKAKELLRQTELRIYEIAESVGFSNADYFVIQFEKVENKTPTEYRNALLTK